jgi:predicted membrane protein
MVLLILLAIAAVVLFGVGFTIHWLFVLAVIAALLFVISLFLGGTRRRTFW